MTFHQLEDGIQTFRNLSESDNPDDFVETLIYSKNKLVVMAGNFVDEPLDKTERKKINIISRWYKPWFYKHVEKMLNDENHQQIIDVEYIPVRDYFHRHTKSIFWELSDIIPFGNHPIYRWLLGWAIPPRVSFIKLTQTEKIKKLYETSHVVQDMLVPINKTVEALNVFHQEYELYPLWVCPYRAYSYDLVFSTKKHNGFLRRPKNLIKGKNYEMYVDLGAYGTPKAVKDKKPDFDIVKTSKKVENYVLGINGFQMLYATSYLNKDEFRKMFNHDHYDEMKSKYDPKGSFPDVFSKTCKIGQETWKIEEPTIKQQGIINII